MCNGSVYALQVLAGKYGGHSGDGNGGIGGGAGGDKRGAGEVRW
jgi:hypothetical protein